jgi:hypothetical protein
MSSDSGSCAMNARAAALSVTVMANRRSPTVIHMRESSCLMDACEASAVATATSEA